MLRGIGRAQQGERVCDPGRARAGAGAGGNADDARGIPALARGAAPAVGTPVALETGTVAFFVARELSGLGCEPLVVDAREAQSAPADPEERPAGCLGALRRPTAWDLSGHRARAAAPGRPAPRDAGAPPARRAPRDRAGERGQTAAARRGARAPQPESRHRGRVGEAARCTGPGSPDSFPSSSRRRAHLRSDLPRGAMAVALDEPFLVVALDEGRDLPLGVREIREAMQPQALLLQRAHEALDHPVALRLADERR